jgi:hypothetical protein
MSRSRSIAVFAVGIFVYILMLKTKADSIIKYRKLMKNFAVQSVPFEFH